MPQEETFRSLMGRNIKNSGRKLSEHGIREIIPNASLYDRLLIYNTESFLCSCPMQNGYICTHNKESHCDK